MNTQCSPLRVLALSAFKSILIALLASIPVSIVYSQENLQKRAPRIEIVQRNHAVAGSIAPAATFQSARVVNNVKWNGKWGIQIYIKFTVTSGISTPCRMTAYFYDEDEEPLESDGSTYQAANGQVAVWKDFTPAYNPAVYNEFTLWIPYSALNLETDPGDEHDLKFYLSISDEYRKRVFAKSGWYDFHLKW